jgi:hypothetical protein
MTGTSEGFSYSWKRSTAPADVVQALVTANRLRKPATTIVKVFILNTDE